MADSNKPVSPTQPTREIGLKLVWDNQPGPDLQLVEHVHMQRFAETVYLTFGQASFPINFSPTVEENIAPIRAVSRLVLSRRDFYLFAALFNEQVKVMGPLPEEPK